MAGFSQRKTDFFRTFLSVIVAAGGTVAPILPAADYYVYKSHSAAVDSAGSGGTAQPFKTYNYAVSAVSAVANAASPKTLYVVPDDYISTTNMLVGQGVKIFGGGIASKVTVAYQGNDGVTNNSWMILKTTNAANNRTATVNGNNEISYMQFDGNALTCLNGIYVMGRSNVKMHHCTIKDFNHTGVTFTGRGDPFNYPLAEDGAPPDVYAIDNEFSDNILLNSSDYAGYGKGALQIGAQDGMQILRNIVDNSGRSNVDFNGYCIKYHRFGFLKNCNISYNKISRAVNSPSIFFIVVEMWNTTGGMIFSYNQLDCDLDIVNFHEGASDFAWDIHHNLIGRSTRNTVQFISGITLEAAGDHASEMANAPVPALARKVKIHHNYFRFMGVAVLMYPSFGTTLEYIDIYSNVMHQCGSIMISRTGPSSYIIVPNITGTLYVANELLNFSSGATAQVADVMGLNASNTRYIFLKNISGTISAANTVTGANGGTTTVNSIKFMGTTTFCQHINYVGNTHYDELYSSSLSKYSVQFYVGCQIRDINIIGCIFDRSPGEYMIFVDVADGGTVDGVLVDHCHISACAGGNAIKYQSNAVAGVNVLNVVETNNTKTPTPYPFTVVASAQWTGESDYKLSADLPSVANALLTGGTDFLGVNRGTTPDIGAYEYVA